jgi:hypothetical protein
MKRTPGTVLVGDVRLVMPRRYHAKANERLVQFLDAFISAGKEDGFLCSPARLETFHVRTMAVALSSVSFEPPATLVVGGPTVAQYLAAMQECGICPDCSADLDAALSLTSSPGWSKCRSCSGPCDAARTKCDKVRGHDGFCAPHPQRGAPWFYKCDLR